MEETFLMGSCEGTSLTPTIGSCVEEVLLQEKASLVLGDVGDLPGAPVLVTWTNWPQP